VGLSAFIFLIVVMHQSIVYADDSVRLTVGRSTVVSVDSPIARVSLTSADIADALVTSPTELLINGKMPGTISMFVWDRAGAIKKYEIVVQRDLARLAEQVKQLFPTEAIDVQSNGRNIVLSGTVTNKDVIERAVNLAGGYVDKKDDVVTLLRLQEGAPTNQVLLRVRFAEINRSALTELGASLFTSPTGVKNTIGRVTTQQFAAPGFDELTSSQASSNFGSDVTSASGKFTFSDFLNFFLFSEKYDIGTMVRALQTRGQFQSLAEPNLVAESGKEASFLAGGEFPIPIAQGSGTNLGITVQFKEFGVRLNFTPTVIGNRVHLKVKPEVSALDFTNAVTLNGFRIPALTTRRTETELELTNGQTFAIAGLINNSMNKTLSKVPGIGDIPILGLLFKSEAAQKNRTELVVMITPIILANNSPGVTGELPRQFEPYLPSLDPKKSMPPPPPSFAAPPRGAEVVVPAPAARNAAAAVPAPAVTPMTSPDAAGSAAKVLALMPSTTPTIVQPTAVPAASPTPAAAVSRPMTDKEMKTLEKAHAEEHERDEKAKASEGKAHAKQIEADRRQAEENKKLEDKAAKEQAKKDAEAVKLAAAAAQRQAEIDKAANDAAAKRAAEKAKRQAEIDKKQAELDKKKQDLDKQ
jgi:pilus assembly protein CpaC